MSRYSIDVSLSYPLTRSFDYYRETHKVVEAKLLLMLRLGRCTSAALPLPSLRAQISTHFQHMIYTHEGHSSHGFPTPTQRGALTAACTCCRFICELLPLVDAPVLAMQLRVFGIFMLES